MMISMNRSSNFPKSLYFEFDMIFVSIRGYPGVKIRHGVKKGRDCFWSKVGLIRTKKH